MTLWKIEFSELLPQALPWQPHIWEKSFHFPLASAVFTRLAWNLAHRTDITWRCENLNFRNCYAKRCHGNHTSGKIISFSFINRYFRKLSLTFLTSIHFLTCMIISILVNILGQIGTAKLAGPTTGDGGTGSGDTMCSDTECSSFNMPFKLILRRCDVVF